METTTTRLGELLLRRSIITLDQLLAATTHQREHGGALVSSLIHLGILSEQDLTTHLHREFRIPIIDPQTIEVSPEVLQLVPRELAYRHEILPIARNGSSLTVAMADPSNLVALNEAKFLTGCDVRVVLAPGQVLRKAIERFYNNHGTRAYEAALTQLKGETLEVVREDPAVDARELQRAAEEAPLVKLVNAIMVDAIEKRASDIHIEPYERDMRVRFRIDGVLYDIMQPPARFKNALASRVKIMASLDITNRRLPQDGAIKLRAPNGKEVSFRVSVLPTIYGEKLVLRILDKTHLQLNPTKLGFDAPALQLFRKAIAQPFGMVLVTGPTGSGKTTTLYSALAEINQSSRNISTAEDPVEHHIRGVNQVQIHEEIGLSFATALRSFLRQDPDVIMVGEIRDSETAEIGIKAALTGHLVLSTLHTNDAPSTMNRLLDMGVQPFLVSSSVLLVVAQRLVRVICPWCKTVVEGCPVTALREIGFSAQEANRVAVYRGVGCDECSHTGYRGRIALYELMSVDDEIRDLILRHSSATDIKRAAISKGMRTLRAAGLTKVREGSTTVEEVLRVTASD